MTDRPWQASETGLSVAIRAVPRASKTEIAGIESDPQGRPVLKLRIAAAPVDGAANKVVTQWLAKSLGVRKGDIIIAAGETGRNKRVEIAGDADDLAKRLEALLS